MMLPKNRFKKALKEGRQQIGLWNSIPGSLTAEMLATCGYEWVVIDTEHALTDIPDTLPMLQAMAPYRTHAVVRPASNDKVLIKRLLDFGAQTLLIPYVQNAFEAKAAVPGSSCPRRPTAPPPSRSPATPGRCSPPSTPSRAPSARMA